MGDIKQKHTEILRLEDRQKQIQSQVKAQKDKGYSPRTSKRMLEQSQKQNENAMVRLEHDVKSLEEQKQDVHKVWKQETQELQQQLTTIRQEVKMLEIKLKEKDQELKLAELKVKELKKQVPNTKLRPMEKRHANARTQGSIDANSVDAVSNLGKQNILNSRKQSNLMG